MRSATTTSSCRSSAQSTRRSGDRQGPCSAEASSTSPPLYDDAWHAASSSGLFEYVDYSTLLALSRVYSLQETYEVQGENVFPLIYQQLYREGAAAIIDNYTGLASMIATFIYRENSLLSEYDQVLEQIDPAD